MCDKEQIQLQSWQREMLERSSLPLELLRRKNGKSGACAALAHLSNQGLNVHDAAESMRGVLDQLEVDSKSREQADNREVDHM